MIEIGKNNILRANRSTDNGFYLIDEKENEVLLPNKYVPEGFKEGDEIDVFIYKDSEDRIVATNLAPLARVGDFAFLRVKEVNKNGAFLDWGLEKDLMLPYREQSGNVESGKRVMVYVYFDIRTERIACSMKVADFLRMEDIDFEEKEEVELVIWKKTDLGYSAIINGKHEGLLYDNEIFTKIALGDKVPGYVKKIREDEKIDLTLQKPGIEKFGDNEELILNNLKANGGFLALHDKSSPEDIKEQLSMSKKTFKKALGGLYKQRKIRLEVDGVHLV